MGETSHGYGTFFNPTSTTMKKSLALTILCLLFAFQAGAFNKNTGTVGNTVCFVRFADEDASIFEHTIDTYQNLFNGSNTTDNSVYNYFRQASYNQLEWKSSFYPVTTDTKIVSYKTRYERAYYQKYDATLRPSGYNSDTEGEARMQALVREIANYIEKDVADATDIDKNDDGYIDNLCIIFSGQSELSNKRGILWPQRKDLALPDEKAIYIKGKKLVGYIMVFDEANGYENFEGIALNTGVLCHEMSHSLGTYDLYHASGSLNPVGIWDLMSDNQLVAQNMTAYTKYRYCKWIDEIPEISKAGTYTLNPVGGSSKENIAYKIKPVGSDEYFVVEYRKQEDFDKSLPGSGLLIYRINPAYTGGNVNYNGTTRLDEQYIFRPNGTITSDGDITKAFFSAESGRTAFGGEATAKPFYSNGKEAPFAISNISTCGSTISFYLHESTNHLSLSKKEITLAGGAQSSATVTISSDEAWTIENLPAWITVSQTEGTGNAEVTFTTNSENNEPRNRTATIMVKTASTEAPLTITQLSNIVTAPSQLTGSVQDDGIHLSWTAASAGETLLYDDFENTENPNGWIVSTSGDRGWRWQKGDPNKGFYRPYEGSYAATMYSAWEDIHQDEYFTSKTFTYGKTLSFYSRTPAAGKKPTNPQYYNVEVSKDNGKSWTPIFNACTDLAASVAGKYTKVTLDLSEYQSAEMQIRFHCYDTDNMGLSYYWQIDNLEILGSGSNNITGYNVYRNGIKIATSTTTEYVDPAPLDGTNTYAVSATGSFGESSPSNSVELQFTSTGISTPTTQGLQVMGVYDCLGRRINSKEMQRGQIYIVKYADGKTKKVSK